ESGWANAEFAQKYLEKADAYVVERRKMFWFVSSLVDHFLSGTETIRLLDLGCGDGVLTEELLKTKNAISATLIDGGEGMLQKAKERLKAFPNTIFVRATFQELIGGAVELGIYDLCVSSMAIHHLEMEEKASLFRLIAAHLNPGGRFVDVDVVLPPSEELEGWYFAMWKGWVGHMMSRYSIQDELPEDLIRRYKDPLSMNKPDTLGDQLRALESAGFVDVDCCFKNGVFVVFGGKRMSEEAKTE
ncbi:MAG TPA: 16S rRNA (cytosine(1402)-N(4))-methyltransferase, partial [Nitrospiraceae bacterium]|nr:16S rRNA (cytosine(1402)-N(4))-methyltransferase [Nitrospiraceae bacterium]